MRMTQSLNGWWDYRIGNGIFVKKQVPYSALPVGRSECCLHFDRIREGLGKRAFLIFEGITYEAKVTLNGSCLGKMLPYCEYRFEVTELLKGTDNVLSVELKDIEPVFGPSEGWENYGGIIRSVMIEYTDALIAEEIIWNGKLSEDYHSAECMVRIRVNGPAEKKEIRTVLRNARGRVTGEGNIVLENGTEGIVTFTITDPELWSPETPYLYTLECSVSDNGKITDFVEQKVGFKDFTTKGKRFYMNGKPYFLLGINRHDLWGDEGHTLSEAQMRKDMQMIKDNGMNYVRLAHYPHNKRILDLADEIGLLVSEEPGLWWSDMENPEVCNGALEVMRRTVLRDRNHISVGFWLAFNECDLNLEYMMNAVRICRENDPYHMVSGANCMELEETKKTFLDGGFDFYTMHPYGSSLDRMKKSAEYLTEMPLLLTEWGGLHCHNNPYLFRQFIEYIISTWHNSEEEPVIAGAAYWFWAEIYELHRGAPACRDGFLQEGLVDAYRNPTPDLDVYRTAFAAINLPPQKEDFQAEYSPVLFAEGAYEPISLSGLLDEEKRATAWAEMIRIACQPISRYRHPNKRERRLYHGPKLGEEIKSLGMLPVELETEPYVITDQIEIPVNSRASALYVIGNTSLPKGFPLEGEYGEEVAKYTIVYTDGSSVTKIMRNGEDITTAVGIFGPSRIEPYAVNSPRILRYSYDFNWEHYVVNLYRLETAPDKTIESFRIYDVKEGYQLLLYGVTLQK